MFDFTIGSGAPVFYDHENAIVGSMNPSTIHTKNTGLQRFFARYLLQKAISVFEWQMPKTWSKDYFLYVLYCWGNIAIINTDKFGVIPQGCSLKGHDVFYRPNTAVITNPLLTGTKELLIGKQCTLIKLQPDYGGIMDLVNFYADMLAVCAETAGVNVVNSKLGYVFAVQNKAAAESFKKMTDQLLSGEPAAYVDKNLMNEDGSPAWQTFTQNLGENYIAGDILSDMRKWENAFDTAIGIPNANTDKKERLITDEVNSNNFETKSKAALWLEELKQSCSEASEMFGITLSVDWREDLKEMEASNE